MKIKRYVLIEDIYSAFSHMRRRDSIKMSLGFKKISDEYGQTVKKILSKSLGKNFKVELYSTSEIDRIVTGAVTAALDQHKEAMCVCVDRSLLFELEFAPKYKSRFFRFQICRTNNDVRVPRHNAPSFAKQIKILKKQIQKNGTKEIIIVDTGIFSGRTIQILLDILERNKLSATTTHIITYLSRTKLKRKFNGIKATVLMKHKEIFEWVDLLDFTPLGGKILNKTHKNSVAEAVPYLFPWSNDEGASLHLQPRFLSTSKKLIEAFMSVVEYHDRHSKSGPIIIAHLLNGGFTAPNNKSRSIKYKKTTHLSKYLKTIITTSFSEPEVLQTHRI